MRTSSIVFKSLTLTFAACPLHPLHPARFPSEHELFGSKMLCEDEYECRDVCECVCITIWVVGIAQTIYRFGYPRNIPGVF